MSSHMRRKIHVKPIGQTRRNTSRHPDFQDLRLGIFVEDFPSAVFVGPGVCCTHSEGGHFVVARGTGWG